MRKEVPLLITFVFGLFMVLEFFIPHPGVTNVGRTFKEWTVIITAFAFVLGVANVARINLEKVSRPHPDRPYAAILLVGLGVMLATGVFGGIETGTFANRLFLYVFTPMQATMFSLLAFYIASAAFRAFRIRSVGAGLLAITAVLVMIGRVPIGSVISDAIGLPALGQLLGLEHELTLATIQAWVMNVPNNAAKRAILIGAALGAIATGLKIIVGIERNYLGE
jgi:hypothetical protein